MSWDEEPQIGGRVVIPADRSSVKMIRNAKGDLQVEVKVVEGTDAAEMDRVRQLAIDNYRQAIVGGGGALE